LTASYDSCVAGIPPACGTPPCFYQGACFPNPGTNSNTLQNLRSVRIYLTARRGSVNDSRAASSRNSAAGISGTFLLQPAVQDSATGNAEAQAWGWAPGGGWAPVSADGTTNKGLKTVDGASWRQVSTEIFLRNLGS
jgi:hypothetical protein